MDLQVVLHCSLPIFKKDSDIVVLLQKVIGYPFVPIACSNLELHATLRMSAIYGWKNFISIK